MGDRANVKIVDSYGPAPIWLYTHWGGSSLIEHVHAGILAGKGRYGDSYLGRIIFREMGSGADENTGFGMSTRMCDNEHLVVVINQDAEEIGLQTEEQATRDDGELGAFLILESLEAFALDPTRILLVYEGGVPVEEPAMTTRDALAGLVHRIEAEGVGESWAPLTDAREVLKREQG